MQLFWTNNLAMPNNLSWPGRFTADNLNKAKNLCSKSVGEKMKVTFGLICYYLVWIVGQC